MGKCKENNLTIVKENICVSNDKELKSAVSYLKSFNTTKIVSKVNYNQQYKIIMANLDATWDLVVILGDLTCGPICGC